MPPPAIAALPFVPLPNAAASTWASNPHACVTRGPMRYGYSSGYGGGGNAGTATYGPGGGAGGGTSPGGTEGGGEEGGGGGVTARSGFGSGASLPLSPALGFSAGPGAGGAAGSAPVQNQLPGGQDAGGCVVCAGADVDPRRAAPVSRAKNGGLVMVHGSGVGSRFVGRVRTARNNSELRRGPNQHPSRRMPLHRALDAVDDVRAPSYASYLPCQPFG